MQKRRLGLLFGVILAYLGVSSAIISVRGNVTWSEWSGWSRCSSTCGDGEQFRRRACHVEVDGIMIRKKAHAISMFRMESHTCIGEKEQKMPCHGNQCHASTGNLTWSEWSRWSPCSSRCGYGEQSRWRTCYRPNVVSDDLKMVSFSCNGERIQKMRCHGRKCRPFSVSIDAREKLAETVSAWTTWSFWSVCSVSCGVGRRTRFRLCNEITDHHPLTLDSSSCTGEMFENEMCVYYLECSDVQIGNKGNLTTVYGPVRETLYDKRIRLALIFTPGLFLLLVILISCYRKWRGRQPYRRTSRDGKEYINPFSTDVKKRRFHKEERIFYDVSGRIRSPLT